MNLGILQPLLEPAVGVRPWSVIEITADNHRIRRLVNMFDNAVNLDAAYLIGGAQLAEQPF